MSCAADEVAIVNVLLIMADELARATQRVLGFQEADERDVGSLRNWVYGNGCIARNEAVYLNKKSDLARLGPAGDDTVACLEPRVESLIVRVYRFFKKV